MPGSLTCCCASSTANNVPYASLTGVMTDDPNERNSITSYRQILRQQRGLHRGSLAVPMVAFLGHGNNALGYQLTMGIFLVLSVVLFLIAFAVIQGTDSARSEAGKLRGPDLSAIC
jgi:Na+/melibiose symporter-like transporter